MHGQQMSSFSVLVNIKEEAGVFLMTLPLRDNRVGQGLHFIGCQGPIPV
jgi:hypothetical protein